MPPKTFGVEHIVYMIVSFLITIVALVLIKIFCKTEKQKTIAYKISAGILLLVVVLNNIFIYQWVNEVKLDSLCGTLSLLFAIFALVCKKDSPCLHFVTYTSLLACLMATIYPTYIGQGSTIFFPSTITSLLHHSISFYMAVLTLLIGRITPDIKKWYVWPLGYCAIITFGLFNIKIRGKSDSMYINYPVISGTILNWLYLGLMFFALYMLFLIIYDTIKNKKQCVLCVGWRKLVELTQKIFKSKKQNNKETSSSEE